MSGSTSSTFLHPLITQNLVETKKYYCPFLERGFCRDNTKCNFSHDTDGSTKIPVDYCHFFLANQCLYGLDCKFRHVEPTPGPSSSQSSTERTSEGLTSSLHYQPYLLDGANLVSSSSTSDKRLLIEPTSTSYDRNGCPSQRMQFLTPLYSAAYEYRLLMRSGRHVEDDIRHRSSDHFQPDLQEETHYWTPPHSNNQENQDDQVNYQNYSEVDEHDQSFQQLSNRYSSSLPALPLNSDAIREYNDTLMNVQPHHRSIGHIVTSDLLLLICDLCGRPCLDPHNIEQQRQHREDCLREHEREMELSFAIQRSKDKFCGICMDVVVEKKPITSSRFGILEKCNHIFCLDCIRKWRGSKQFDTRTIRACPECRTCSDFVVPSKYWVEDQDDKERLIHDYKAALKSKPCKYFNEGKGECPFAGSCFYKHAYPDGRIAKLDNPKPRRRNYANRRTASVANFILWSLLTSTDDDDEEDEDDEDDDEDEDVDVDDFDDDDLFYSDIHLLNEDDLVDDYSQY